MPADNAKALNKATSLDADVILVDLEDGAADKKKARANIAPLMRDLAAGPRRPQRVVLRINGVASPFFKDDVAALRKAAADLSGLHALAIPKAEEFCQLQAVSDAVGVAMRYWAVVETPAGILRCERMCSDAASALRDSLKGQVNGVTPELEALVAGTSDLTKDLRARHTDDRLPMLHSLSHLVLCARTYGLLAIDGVHLDLRPAAAPVFEAHCRQGRDMGFDGKSLIHPSQIGACNKAFAPSEDELARAQAIVDAAQAQAAAAAAAGGSADTALLVVNGQLVEGLHVAEAKRLLALRDAIAAKATLRASAAAADALAAAAPATR